MTGQQNVNIPTRTCESCGWTTTKTRFMHRTARRNTAAYQCNDRGACERRRAAASAVPEPCTSESPDYPGLACNLVAGHDVGHYALGHTWPRDPAHLGEFLSQVTEHEAAGPEHAKWCAGPGAHRAEVTTSEPGSEDGAWR
jgi:hypothetical protein